MRQQARESTVMLGLACATQECRLSAGTRLLTSCWASESIVYLPLTVLLNMLLLPLLQWTEGRAVREDFVFVVSLSGRCKQGVDTEIDWVSLDADVSNQSAEALTLKSNAMRWRRAAVL